MSKSTKRVVFSFDDRSTESLDKLREQGRFPEAVMTDPNPELDRLRAELKRLQGELDHANSLAAFLSASMDTPDAELRREIADLKAIICHIWEHGRKLDRGASSLYPASLEAKLEAIVLERVGDVKREAA